MNNRPHTFIFSVLILLITFILLGCSDNSIHIIDYRDSFILDEASFKVDDINYIILNNDGMVKAQSSSIYCE